MLKNFVYYQRSCLDSKSTLHWTRATDLVGYATEGLNKKFTKAAIFFKVAKLFDWVWNKSLIHTYLEWWKFGENIGGHSKTKSWEPALAIHRLPIHANKLAESFVKWIIAVNAENSKALCWFRADGDNTWNKTLWTDTIGKVSDMKFIIDGKLTFKK